MKPNDDPFVTLTPESLAGEPGLASLANQRERPAATSPLLAPAVGRLQGFDPLDRPLVGALGTAPGGLFAARTTVALRRSMLGREVLVVFEDGALDRPVIVGVIEPHALQETPEPADPGVRIQADSERYVIRAEREIVLQCGDASITLTRAGKVLIRGSYILSRSTGYNKIKGAAIDIN